MNEKSVRKLENYWAALVDNNSTGLDNIRNEEGDPQLALDLLDELNAARLVMQDDTSVFHDSDWPTPGEAMPSETGHLAIGTKIDGYVLTQFLGRGGMALVYAAEQVALSRIVALKLIRSGPLASEDDRFRFQSEIMATASLEHPGIVSIIDTGVWCGFHYFSMEFIDGPSLADVLREELIPPKTAAEYSLAIAQAVEHAHKNGVLHRDLKPSNIMLRRGSRPCILDFGLAKFYAHDALSANELTKTGTMVGTPSYMSPEQALGFSRQVTFASDVYSMGVVLYEMITGRPPFRAANSVETMRQVIDNDPAPPRTLNSEIPSDLETICLKCLSKLPMERYQTSQELADELQRFLEGRPIVARPISSVRRAWRWCQRNRMTAGLITLLVISLLSGTLVSSAMWWKSRRNEILATERGDKLVASNEQLGDAMLSFYDRALKEGAFLDLSTHFRNELTSEMNRYYGLMIENSDHDPEVTRKIVTQLLRLSEDYFNWGHDSTSLFILNSSDDYIDRLVSTSELAEPDVNLKTEFLYRQAAALWSSGSKVQAKETFLEALDWARKGIEFDRNEHTENLLKKIELGLIADEIVSKGFEQGGPKLLSFIEKLQHLEQQYPDSVKILDTLMEAYGKLAKLTPVAQQAIDGRRKKQDVMDRIIAISESTGAPAELYRSYRTSNLVFFGCRGVEGWQSREGYRWHRKIHRRLSRKHRPFTWLCSHSA